MNRAVLENILKAPCHANCHVLMSVLPFLHTFFTNPDRLTDSFTPPAESVFLLCPFLSLQENVDSKWCVVSAFLLYFHISKPCFMIFAWT